MHLCIRWRNSAATSFALPILSIALAGNMLSARDGHAQDAAKGKDAFVRQCAICHTINKGGPNGFGPNLFGIVGRKAATVPEYNYSRAFQTAANWVWDEGLLRPWISLPGTMVPGNKMAVFQGVAERDRDDIIAYVAAQK